MKTIGLIEENNSFECFNFNCDFSYILNKIEPLQGLNKLFNNQKTKIIRGIKVLQYNEAKIELNKFKRLKNYTGEEYAVVKSYSSDKLFENIFNNSSETTSTNSNFKEENEFILTEIKKLQQSLETKLNEEIEKTIFSAFMKGGC